MLYKTDYHVHTSYSDGKAIPAEYINAAISSGLSEIGFSEHLNLVNEKQKGCLDISEVHAYITHIKSLRKAEKKIKVRIGLEVDYSPGKEEVIHDFLRKIDLDYVIGSVHYLDNMNIDSRPEYDEGKNIDDLFQSYFNIVNEAVASRLFDIIGHCDLVRIYNFKPVADPEPLYRKLARKLSEHDVAFEINTNGKNRLLGDFYPDRRFLGIFKEENVPVCVNSDSHIPARLGQYFDEAYGMLKEAGYKEMAVFSKRERFLVPADF